MPEGKKCACAGFELAYADYLRALTDGTLTHLVEEIVLPAEEFDSLFTRHKDATTCQSQS